VLLASDDTRERRQAILIQVDPDYGPGWLLAGMAKWRAGDLDAAEPLLWGAIERAPSDPACYLPLSHLYRQRGDLDLWGP